MFKFLTRYSEVSFYTPSYQFQESLHVPLMVLGVQMRADSVEELLRRILLRYFMFRHSPALSDVNTDVTLKVANRALSLP